MTGLANLCMEHHPFQDHTCTLVIIWVLLGWDLGLTIQLLVTMVIILGVVCLPLTHLHICSRYGSLFPFSSVV
uniref:Uncharacterized protein n=1 Tax=Picea sitchensis TaxID=3332 RepID=A9NLH7_PICSI|nr:unknown [Picea sitchensis]